MLTTVTFGETCASYLASRTIQKLAEDEVKDFPLASSREDFYIDDLVSGAKTSTEAKYLKGQLIALLKRGCFNLRQWMSNDPSLRDDKQNQAEILDLCSDHEDSNKVLGIQWNPNTDMIKYSVNLASVGKKTTKRTILSQIAQIFDPLGLLGPVIVAAKLIMQDLWKETGLGWDQTVPQYIYTKWHDYKKELVMLNDFQLERQLFIQDEINIQLHGFCDASESAYGACIYIRSTNKLNQHKIQLLCSKSRVAPLKSKLTIPKLELCAALLLVKLYEVVLQALKLEFDEVVFWSDSEITLNWISKSPHTLKTFVANRVSEIQSITNIHNWSHIATQENPADAISRGQNAASFLENSQWLTGPTWLALDRENWSIQPVEIIETPERRTQIALVNYEAPTAIFERFSTFTSVLHFVACCLRIIQYVKTKTKTLGELTVNEIEIAHRRVIHIIQGKHFRTEIKDLREKHEVGRRSKILNLSPFIDEFGILRVGGRLKNAPIGYSQKHPILLPSHDHLTTILIRQTHVKHWHAGSQATLNIIRNRYWIVDGKNTIRHIIHKCVICRKANPTIPTYIMGDLPTSRFNKTRPFVNVGIDYCGPFYIKEKKLRNRVKVKVYVAVFICLATKAIHLELVSDLTTDSCLASIKRFFARRGKAKNIYTDTGTNFLGTKNEILKLQATIYSVEYNQKIQNTLSDENINWHFIPPRAPHFGGLWEAGVKSFKHHLYRTIGDSLFTYEQFNTFIIEIEAILNSRPLTPLSSDPNDLIPLTPAHFPIGDSLAALPEHHLITLSSNRLSQWQLIQKTRQHFWKRWQKEYLNELQVKSKWHTGKITGIDIGTLVVIKEDGIQPMNWKMGRVIAVHQGDDQIIRVATVKTTDGVYKRCIKKLCPLF